MSNRLVFVIAGLGLLLPIGTIYGQQVGLIGHWPLDEGTGLTTADVSGNGHGGTLEGVPDWVPGMYGQALDFNGVSDVVIASHSPLMDVENQLTIAAWIKPRSYSERLGTGLVQRSASSVPYGLQIYENGAVRFIANQLFQNVIGGGEWNTVAKLPLDEWTHAAVTYDSETIKFYINGAQDEREVETEIIFKVTSQPLWIGRGDIRNATFDGMIDDVWLYNRGLSEDEIQRVVAGGSFDYAGNPSPASKAKDVPRIAELSWTPGESAALHNVYLGTSFDDVNTATVDNPLGVLVSPEQEPNVYMPEELLKYGETYYWRVDEVNAPPDLTIFPGAVWMFEVEPRAYPVPNIVATASSSKSLNNGPEKTVDGSGLNEKDEHSTSASDMWISEKNGPEPVWVQYSFDQPYKLESLSIWNSNQSLEFLFGLSVKDVTIQTSSDGENWTDLKDVQAKRGTGKPNYTANTEIDLDGVFTQYVRLLIQNNWKGSVAQYSISEVRFYYLPVAARQPQPVNGAVNVDPGISALQWRPGREAAEHQVILSIEREAVEDNSALLDTVTDTRFDPAGLLSLDTQYYWRINEVNETQTPSTYPGAIWQFTTSPYIVVDDMESYTNSPGYQLWFTWVDGFDDPDNNGALVGNGFFGEPETLIVRNGDQSMPFYYGNTAANVSEATRTYETPQDWTRGGITSLVLYVQGTPDNNLGQLYVSINGVKVNHPDSASLLRGVTWQPWVVDLSQVNTQLNQVTSVTIGISGNQTGVFYVDDIRLYKDVPAAPEQVLIEAEAGTLTAPFMTSNGADASGGQSINTPDNEQVGTREDGIATYNFTVQGGVYKVYGRVKAGNGANSFWARIPDATTNTTPHPDNDGFVRWNGIPISEYWIWDVVRNDQGPGPNGQVLFTLTPGNHTLEIAYREDGAQLDAILIVAQD